MENFKRPRLTLAYQSESDESSSSSSNDSWMIEPPDSLQWSATQFSEFAHGLNGQATSTQLPDQSQELFTDSEVSHYQRTNGTATPNPLLTLPTPLPVPNFEWVQRASTTPAEDFAANDSGWQALLTPEMKEIDFWKIVVPQQFIGTLVEESNRYADKLIAEAEAAGVTDASKKPSRRMTKFQRITSEEMQRYLMIRVLMGIDDKPELANYWSKDPILRSLIIPQIMSSDRFFEIQRYLHLCNDDEIQMEQENDKLKKIRAIWNMVMKHFKTLLIPGKYVSVDESLTKFKGRLSFKQLILTKRNRFGIKSHNIIDEDTKFVLNSIVYCGKDDEAVLKYDKKTYGYGGAILLELCEPFLGKNRTIFADNYFTSPILAEKLLKEKTYCVGTLRAGRKHTPVAPKMKKGQIFAYCCEKENYDIMVEYWKDKRTVRMISTGQHHNVVETRNARGTRKRKLETIELYNHNARGTDQADMCIGYYDCGRKTMKWSTKMFFRLFELCLYNAFVMMRSLHPKKPFLEFRMNLARQIIASTGGISTQRKLQPPRNNELCGDRLTSRCVCPAKGTKRRCVVCSKK